MSCQLAVHCSETLTGQPHFGVEGPRKATIIPDLPSHAIERVGGAAGNETMHITHACPASLEGALPDTQPRALRPSTINLV